MFKASVLGTRCPVLLVIIPILFGLISCNDNGEHETTPKVTSTMTSQTPTDKPDEPVVITIGNITDQTGPGAQGLSFVDLSLHDVVEYYNNNDLIPGVKFKVINYDTQYDAAKAVPGYEKLKSDGADFFWTPLPIVIPIIKSRLDRDELVAFTATANMKENELTGGYIFNMGITPKNEAYTLLDWIAKNDEDFPADRPAKVGGAAWSDGYHDMLFEAAEDYCDAHPDIYKWDTEFLTDVKFSWKIEAEQLSDCDYVFVPALPHLFMRDFRDTGAKAKFLGTDVPLAFLRELGEMGLWNDIDGSLFIRSSRWYNESGPIIDIINQFIDDKYSDQMAAEIRKQGVPYLGFRQCYLVLDVVKKAVEEVGAEKFDSQALYDAAVSWKYDYEGIPGFHSFDENERTSSHYYAIYEANGEEKDIFRVHDEWLPEVDSLE